ncbi:hypothetical protein GCM10009680_20720 [Streptomyces yatensis]|uniref:Uncharacterized protein n=1 Tax=Streptomyces yatensis TaxID=155177 RepID=A0ABN2H4L2_9ACTN
MRIEHDDAVDAGALPRRLRMGLQLRRRFVVADGPRHSGGVREGLGHREGSSASVECAVFMGIRRDGHHRGGHQNQGQQKLQDERLPGDAPQPRPGSQPTPGRTSISAHNGIYNILLVLGEKERATSF